MPTFRFLNLDGSPPQGFQKVFKWAVLDKVAGRRPAGPLGTPAPWRQPDLAALKVPPAAGAGARLTWLGHASWLIQMDGVSLVVDPVLGQSISYVVKRHVPPGLTVEQLPPLEACLVTHSHYDHLDLPTLKAIGRPVVGGTGLSGVFRGTGLTCSELGWWEPKQLGPLKVTFVPSQHWSKRSPFQTNDTLWGGFVVEGSSARVYHAGDTAFFEGFLEIGRRFPGLDAAMLPIGAYDPAWFMQKQHMNPEEATRAFEDLKARAFFAMHWGTFKLTDEPLDEPPRRFWEAWRKGGHPVAAARVLAVGESAQVVAPT